MKNTTIAAASGRSTDPRKNDTVTGISRDLWLNAIQDTEEPLCTDPNALTVVEFAKLYQCGNSTARKRLLEAEKDGRVRVVSKWVTDTGGRRLRVRAYQVCEPRNRAKHGTRTKTQR